MSKGKILGASAMLIAAWLAGALAWAGETGMQPTDADPVTMTTDYTLDNGNVYLSQSLSNTGSFSIGVAGVGGLYVDPGIMVATTPTSGNLGALIGDQATSFGQVNLMNAKGGHPALFQINGDLILGNYGAGQITTYGAVVVQGDLMMGLSGAATGGIYMVSATGSVSPSVTVYGRTLLGVGSSTQGGVAVNITRHGKAAFYYGRELDVGVAGRATFGVEGATLVAPTPGEGPGIIRIGSQDPSSTFLTGNSMTIGSNEKYGSTLIGDTLTIGAGTKLVNFFKVGLGSQVTLNTSVVIGNNADLVMSGGVLTTQRITQLGNGQIFGNGTIVGPIENNTIYAIGRKPPFIDRASSDTLTLNGDVTGPETVLTIGERATLALLESVGGTIHINFPVTTNDNYLPSNLRLGSPATMGGLISNFVRRDNIDLIGKTPVTHAYHDYGDGSGALSLTFADGSFAKLNFIGTYMPDQFGFISDGAGGTRIFLR